MASSSPASGRFSASINHSAEKNINDEFHGKERRSNRPGKGTLHNICTTKQLQQKIENSKSLSCSNYMNEFLSHRIE
jgi:hypothetical protein